MNNSKGSEGIKAKLQYRGAPEDQVVIERQCNSGYIVRDIGGQVGEIGYRLVDLHTWVLERTYLESRYSGGMLARQLLDLVVAVAREAGAKIIPSCSYALVQFKRHAEYADVWKREGRVRFECRITGTSGGMLRGFLAFQPFQGTDMQDNQS